MLRREILTKRETGLGYELHFSPKRQKSEKQQDGCGTDSLIFDVLLQDQVGMKETLDIWELLCAFSCHVIASQLLHKNLFFVKDLSVLLKIIQKFCVLVSSGLLKPVPVPCSCQASLFFPQGLYRGKGRFRTDKLYSDRQGKEENL